MNTSKFPDLTLVELLALAAFILSVCFISYIRNYLRCYLISQQIQVKIHDSTYYYNDGFNERTNVVNTVGDVVTVLIKFVGWDNWAMTSTELLFDAENINIGLFARAHHVDPEEDVVDVTKSHITPGDPNSKLKVEFSVKKTGIYDFTVDYKSFQVPSSPFTLAFNCGPLDPLQSALISQSPTLLCYKTYKSQNGVNSPYSVCNIFVIEPVDEYGNISDKADLQKLSFRIQEIKKLERKIELTVPELKQNYDYQAEFLTNPHHREIKLIIKANFYKAGVYRGEIAYDNVLLHNGLFNALVIDIKEQQLIMRILERGFPLPKLEAHLYCNATTFIAVRIVFDNEDVRINDRNEKTGLWTKTITTYKTTSLRIEIMLFDEESGKCQLKLYANPEAQNYQRLAISPLIGKLFIVILSNIQIGNAQIGNAKRFEISTLLHQNVFL